jgi:hypothetical protein
MDDPGIGVRVAVRTVTSPYRSDQLLSDPHRWVSFLGVKQPGREAHHLPPTSNVNLYTPLHMCLWPSDNQPQPSHLHREAIAWGYTRYRSSLPVSAQYVRRCYSSLRVGSVCSQRDMRRPGDCISGHTVLSYLRRRLSSNSGLGCNHAQTGATAALAVQTEISL